MIIRAENRETFTVISNELLNDNRITDKALGTLVRLLSNADHWNLNVNYMVKTGKQGRTAVRSSIAELEKAGYIHRDVVRNQAGRITGTEYLIYESPGQAKGVNETDTPSMKATTTRGCSNLSSPPVTEEAEHISERVSPGTTPLEMPPNLGRHQVTDVASNSRQPIIQNEVPE